MAVNSFEFLLIFFSFLAIYYILPKIRILLLFLFNLYFYILLMPQHITTILVCSFLAYIVGLILDNISNKFIRKALLSFSIILFVFLIIYFKNYLKINYSKSIIAPIGISFFTLQIISYMVDVYKNKISCEKNLLNFLTYVTFFGTITSGPIERAKDFLPQLKKKPSFNIDYIFAGFKFLILGLFFKAVGDQLAVFTDIIFNNVDAYKGYPLILSGALYLFQLYADFSGYSLIVFGLSRLLSLDISKNFDFPLFSKNPKEFWRKWHISLSTWLRDYVYFPLGGSRKSYFRTKVNIMIVFILSGIWHGVGPTYLLWGIMQGLYQLPRKYFSINKYFDRLINYFFMAFSFIFFRANSIKDGVSLIKNSFHHLHPRNIAYLTNIVSLKTIILIFILICAVLLIDYFRYKEIKLSLPLKSTFYIVLFFAVLLLDSGVEKTFIYFKF